MEKKKGKKEGEAIEGIREKIRELDELDDNFILLRKEWDKIEKKDKEPPARPPEKLPEKPTAKPPETRKGFFGVVKGLFNVKEPTTKPPEKPTAKPSEKPTTKPPEKPTTKPPEKPIAKPSEKPTTKPPEKPTTKPPEKPTAKPPEKPTTKPPEKPTAKPPEKPTAKPSEKKEGFGERKLLPVETMSKEEILRELRGESITKNDGGINKEKRKPVEEDKRVVKELHERVEEKSSEDDIPNLGRMEPEQVMKMLREDVGEKERADLKGITKVRKEAVEEKETQTGEEHQEKEEKPEKKDKISKKDKLGSILRNMELKADGIQGSAIVTRDGLIVASRLPSGVDLNAFGGFSASFFGATETAVYELKKVRLYDAYIESDEGKVIAVESGEYVFLVTLVKLNANTGLVLMYMKKAAKDIMKIMES